MISAVGISTIDHLMQVKNFSQHEGTFFCDNYSVDGGGMAATGLCAAAKLGSKTRLFSRVGDDVNGKFIEQGLKNIGVDTSGLKFVENANSFTTFILIETSSGDKQFWCEQHHKAFEKHISIDKELLKDTTVLLVDGFWMEAAQEAAGWAFENKVPVVADFKEQYKGLDKLMPYINYLIVPDFFASEVTGKSDLKDALVGLKKLMKNGVPVITQSSKGGVYLDGDKMKNYQVFKIDNVVDSTGAGDSFHGAFCHFLDQRMSLADCLKYSSAVGALNCRAVGGRKGLPDMKEVNELVSLHSIIND